MSTMEYNFNITTPLEVEETVGETKILTGTFLRLNKATKNGREYLIEEGESIAEGLIDMPIRHGADWMGRHIKNPLNEVGRVIEAWLDEATNTIKGKIQVWNTAKFPDIIARIRNGWGFSIGGTAQNLLPTGALNRLGRAIMRVIGMKPNHLQLLKPETKRGQDEAQVEDLDVEETFYEIEESYTFDPCPWGVCELPVESPEEVEEMVEETEKEVIKKEDFMALLERLESLESEVRKSIEPKDTRVKKDILSIERTEDDSFVLKSGGNELMVLDKDTKLYWDGETLDTESGNASFGVGRLYVYEEPKPNLIADSEYLAPATREYLDSMGLLGPKEEETSTEKQDEDTESKDDSIEEKTDETKIEFTTSDELNLTTDTATTENTTITETKTQEELDAEVDDLTKTEEKSDAILEGLQNDEHDTETLKNDEDGITYIVPGKGVKKIRHG